MADEATALSAAEDEGDARARRVDAGAFASPGAALAAEETASWTMAVAASWMAGFKGETLWIAESDAATFETAIATVGCDGGSWNEREGMAIRLGTRAVFATLAIGGLACVDDCIDGSLCMRIVGEMTPGVALGELGAFGAGRESFRVGIRMRGEAPVIVAPLVNWSSALNSSYSFAIG